MYDVSPFLLTGEPSTSQWLHVAFAIVGVTPATSIEPRWVQTQLTSCICCFVLHVATRNPLIFISSGNQFFSWHAYCTGIKHKLNTINLAKIQYYTYILMWNILRYQMADQHTHTHNLCRTVWQITPNSFTTNFVISVQTSQDWPQKAKRKTKMWSTCIYRKTPLKQGVTEAKLVLSLKEQSG